MPFRLHEKYGEFRAKIQFTTAAWMPYKIYQACLATGILSQTAYCQIALCERLARDLDLNLDELVAQLPTHKTSNRHLFDPTGRDTPTPGPDPVGERLAGHTQVMVARYGMADTDPEVY